MAAFSHNGEPGSALDAELKGRDTRHREGYSAGFKAGREAGMREAAELCQSHEPKDFTTAGIITRAKCAEVILSAIGGGK